jgi:hypothetical protein
MMHTGLRQQKASPAVLLFFSLWILWGFGFETVGTRLRIQLNGAVISSRDIPPSRGPRYATGIRPTEPGRSRNQLHCRGDRCFVAAKYASGNLHPKAEMAFLLGEKWRAGGRLSDSLLCSNQRYWCWPTGLGFGPMAPTGCGIMTCADERVQPQSAQTQSFSGGDDDRLGLDWPEFVFPAGDDRGS